MCRLSWLFGRGEAWVLHQQSAATETANRNFTTLMLVVVAHNTHPFLRCPDTLHQRAETARNTFAHPCVLCCLSHRSCCAGRTDRINTAAAAACTILLFGDCCTWRYFATGVVSLTMLSQTIRPESHLRSLGASTAPLSPTLLLSSVVVRTNRDSENYRANGLRRTFQLKSH